MAGSTSAGSWLLFQSLVVMKISERGMPDFLMAWPTAGSVPGQVLKSVLESSGRGLDALTVDARGVNVTVSGLEGFEDSGFLFVGVLPCAKANSSFKKNCH